MNKKTIIITILIGCMLLLLPGCWDAMELENMYYAHTVGIDYVNDEYVIYVSLINFTAIQSASTDEGSGGGENKDQAKVGVGKGRSIAEAVHNIYKYTQRRVYWGHLTAAVLSEQVMKHNPLKVIDMIDRFNETRNTIWIYGTRDPMDRLLNTPPILAYSVIFSVLGDPWDTYSQYSTVQPIRMHDFHRNLLEPAQTVVLPNMNLKQSVWLKEDTLVSGIGIDGAHFIQNNQWKGLLTNNDALGIRWMQNKTQRTLLQIEDEEGTQEASIIFNHPQHQIKINQQGDKVSFVIHISVDGAVEEMLESVSEEYIHQAAIKTIRNEIEHTYKKGLDQELDVLQLSYQLYRHNPQLWKKLTVDGQLPLSPSSITVHVKANIVHSYNNKLRIR